MENSPKWWILFGFRLNCNTIINDGVRFTHNPAKTFRWLIFSFERTKPHWKRQIFDKVVGNSMKKKSCSCIYHSGECQHFKRLLLCVLDNDDVWKAFSEIDCLERLMACNQRMLKWTQPKVPEKNAKKCTSDGYCCVELLWKTKPFFLCRHKCL